MSWARAVRLAGPTGAAALSGVLCGLAFPLVDWKALAWIGLVPLFVALRRTPLLWTPALAGVWSLALWTVVWDWGPRAVVVYFGQPIWVGVAFFTGLAFLTIAPPAVLSLLACRVLADRFRIFLPLLAGAAWASGELLRGRLVHVPFPVGNPWAILGVSQAGLDPVAQLASVTGVYGVSFVLVATNTALAELILAWRAGGSELRRALGALFVAAVVVASCLAYGFATLRDAPGGPLPGAAVRVGLVQPDLDPASHWSPGLYGSNLALYLKLSEELTHREDVDLLLWPESAMTFFLEDEPDYRRAIASHLGRLDVELLAGAPRLDGDAFLNSLYLLSPGGTIEGRYDKRVLIPFAEYAPLGWFDILRRKFGAVREYRAGSPRPPLPTRAGPAGVLICNESMFGELAAERVREGAEILINAVHDGWIPSAEYAEQQFQLATWRAVEQRRYLVRISTSGPSAVVDPWGRVRARSDAFVEATIATAVEPRSDRTVYGRVGDLFAVLCGVVTLATTGLALARRTPSRVIDSPPAERGGTSA